MDIAFVVTTLLGVTTIYFAWKQSARPRLDFEVTYLNPVLGPRERITDALEVRWVHGNPPDTHVFALKLGNYGRAPIVRSDYEGPIRIDFDTAYLLGAYLSDSSPSDLEPGLDMEEDERNRYIEINPLLLNPGDWFEVQAFTNGSPHAFKVSARIRGVRRIRDRVAYRKKRGLLMNWAVPLSLGVVFVWLWWGLNVAGYPDLASSLIAAVIGGLAGVTIGMFEGRRP